MGWTSDQKRYHTNKWYCSSCDKRTAIDLNPDWVKAGKPLKWEGKCEWEWFSRCAMCHKKHWDKSEYDCPNCGYSSIAPEFNGEKPPDWEGEWEEVMKGTLVQMTKHKYNSYYSYQFGGAGYDWEEQHQCPKCKTKWWFTNSTC